MRRLLVISLLAASALLTSCASLHESADAVYENVEVLDCDEGIASYYSNAFQGRRTASGERYNRNLLTAAHRSYPFGTMIRVRSARSGESVIVRVNDRGPSKRSRVLDLSYAAAARLGMLRAGLVQVSVEVLSWGPSAASRAVGTGMHREPETADNTKNTTR